MRTSEPRYLSIISRGTYLLVPLHRRKALRPWTLEDLKERKGFGKGGFGHFKGKKGKGKGKGKKGKGKNPHVNFHHAAMAKGKGKK